MSEALTGVNPIPKKKSIIFAEPSVDSSGRVESRTPSGNTTSIKRFIIEVAKQRSEVKHELSKLCEGFNLLIFMIYVLLCTNWYLLGVQWFPDRIIEPELECHIKDLENVEWSFYEKRNFTSPNAKLYVPGCFYYNINYSHLNLMIFEAAAELISKIEVKPQLLKCQNYTIKFDVPKEISFHREFNKYCIKKSLLSTTPYGRLGIICFGFPCGILADIYGRKPIYFSASILLTISAFVLACSPNFLFTVIATFLLWGSLVSVNLALAIIYSEIYRHKYRTAGMVVSFCFMIIGIALTSFQRIFDIIQVWRLRTLAFAFTASILLFGIIIVPESPRYLIKNRQFKKAWLCLEELGDDENPDAQDFEVIKPTLKYQMKVLTKWYMLHRVYTILILNGVAIIFNSIYLNRRKTIVQPKNEKLEVYILLIQIFLFIGTGVTSVYYSKKVLLATYFVLLCICISINMSAKSNMVMKVSSLAGYMFPPQINILTYTYLFEIIPTSHRATSLGLYFSINNMSEFITDVFQEELSWEGNTRFYSGFYCGLCAICVLIAFVSPNHGLELPDRKQDLLLRLSLDRERFQY